MKVTVDGSDAQAKWREDYEHIRTLPFRALRLAKDAAQRERTSSTYQNRTGLLRGETGAELKGGHLGFRIYLHQGAPYGVFVQARGFSHFTEIGDETMEALARLMTGNAG